MRIIASIGGIGVVLAIADRVFNPPKPIPPMPTLVTRAEWGAVPPNHEALNEYGVTADPTSSGWYVYSKPLADVYNTVVIHHSAVLLAANETMPSVQRLHLDVNHWADVGYHFAIDRRGVIYEGRDIHVRGASVAGHNTGVIGVVVMGNFELDYPLSTQLTSLQSLVNWLASAYTLTHLAGHREFNLGTVCPGRNLFPQLDSLAQTAGLQRGTDGYVAPT